MTHEEAQKMIERLYASDDPSGPRKYSRYEARPLDNDNLAKGYKVMGRRQGDNLSKDELAR